MAGRSSLLRRGASPVIAMLSLGFLSGCITSERLLLEDAAGGRDGLPRSFVVEAAVGPIGFFSRDAAGSFREIVSPVSADSAVIPGHHYVEPWATQDFARNQQKLLHAQCAQPAYDCAYALLVGTGTEWTQYVVNKKDSPYGVASVDSLGALKAFFTVTGQRYEASGRGRAKGIEVIDFTFEGQAYGLQVQPLRLKPAGASTAAVAQTLLGVPAGAAAATAAAAPASAAPTSGSDAILQEVLAASEPEAAAQPEPAYQGVPAVESQRIVNDVYVPPPPQTFENVAVVEPEPEPEPEPKESKVPLEDLMRGGGFGGRPSLGGF